VRISTRFVLLFFSGGLLSLTFGESIGVDFTNGAWTLASTDQPGVAAGANWTNVVGGSGSDVVLQDDAGTATSALLTYSANVYDGFPYPQTANNATNILYKGGLAGTAFSVTIADIPYADYSIYTFASSASSRSDTLSITDGATTFYYASDGSEYVGDGSPFTGVTSLTQTTSTDSLDPTDAMAQYQLFNGESNSTLTLTLGGGSGSISNNLFGFQIVDEAPTPEPGSIFLLAGAVLLGGSMCYRRLGFNKAIVSPRSCLSWKSRRLPLRSRARSAMQWMAHVSWANLIK